TALRLRRTATVHDGGGPLGRHTGASVDGDVLARIPRPDLLPRGTRLDVLRDDARRKHGPARPAHGAARHPRRGVLLRRPPRRTDTDPPRRGARDPRAAGAPVRTGANRVEWCGSRIWGCATSTRTLGRQWCNGPSASSWRRETVHNYFAALSPLSSLRPRCSRSRSCTCTTARRSTNYPTSSADRTRSARCRTHGHRASPARGTPASSRP